MEKFTKGPWVRKYHANGCNYVSAQDVSLNDCYSIASCSGQDEIANSHLIAAAPEMYAMLKLLLDDEAVECDYIDSIDLLLAKAIGEL